MAILNGAALRAAVAFRRKIEKQFTHYLMRIVKDISQLFNGVKSPREACDLITKYADSKQFNNLVDTSVKKMVTHLYVGEKQTWRQAAAESIQGKAIYQELRRETSNTYMGMIIDKIVQDNANLIKTIPSLTVRRDLTKMIQELQMKGMRPEEITDRIAGKCPGLLAYQIRRIARTESSKAASALTNARCDVMGIHWYEWSTCEDERVRDSHAHMNGILCRWSDPPAPEQLAGQASTGHYHPGNIYNCRCIALPVIDMQDISFPCRVYANGRITTIGSVNEFKRRFGEEL